MEKISSKYFNLLCLDEIIQNSKNLDGALILTSFGLIVGKINMPTQEISDNPAIADIIAHQKGNIDENNIDYDLIGDGSIISIKDATIKYSNNSIIKINDITIHCDDIIGFSPVKIQDFLSQSK